MAARSLAGISALSSAKAGKMMRFPVLLLASVALCAAGAALPASAFAAGDQADARALQAASATAPAPRFESPLAGLNFPLLTALRADPAWAAALRDDEVLLALIHQREKRISAATQCTALPGCRVTPWLWTEADIATVGERLTKLAHDPRLHQSLITGVLRPSHQFALHEKLDDRAFLLAAWKDAARGMNYNMRVYAAGEAPRYPKIDSIIFDVTQPEYALVLAAQEAITLAQRRPDDLFFDSALRYVTSALIINERDDAAGYRPLPGEDNAATIDRLKQVDWRNYPYSALLVFGHGPEDALSRTGVMGHLRLRLAADRFHQGLAPVIILSGGAVHPNRTRFNEAVEMRTLLTDHYGVPANHILIEPHARHTTTNLRNVARLIFAADIPASKDALILSTPETIAYIGGSELARRNKAELGYLPGTIGPGPDALSLTFRPDRTSLHIDPMDPLDP